MNRDVRNLRFTAQMNSKNISTRALKVLLKGIELAVPWSPPWRDPFQSEILSGFGVRWIEFQSTEEMEPCSLTGWTASPARPSGTVFLLHGFREGSYSQWIVEPAERFSSKLNLAVVAVDLRYHGKSEKRLPSFGFAESLDVAGAMDWAEAQGYPKPYILHGGSLGAMAAAICAARDSRVAGAFLKSPPASADVALSRCSPKVSLPMQSALLSGAINTAYGYDVIKWGCIRSYEDKPAHKPRIFYAVGEFEEYGYDLTKKAFDHWYQGEDVKLEVPPAQAWDQSKWFRTAWDGYHDFGLKEYPEMYDDVDAFFRKLTTSIRD